MRAVSAHKIYARVPNHLGDVLMSIPALQRLAQRYAGSRVDAWCPEHLASVLESARLDVNVVAFRRTRSLWLTARRIRRYHYERAYLFTPSFSTAAVARLAGIPERRGTPTDRRRWLLSDAEVSRERPGEHRASFYMRLVDPASDGELPAAPRVVVRRPAAEEFAQLVDESLQGPVLGLLPGSNAAARRWPVGNFSALAGLLAGEVGSVLVFGGAGERALTARVAAGAGEGGVDLGGRTSLPVLAAGLSICDLVVGNDTGPLHLAAAVGAPVLGLFGSSDPRRTAPLGSRVSVLWQSKLPCAPCHKNRCGRRGLGTVLPEAQLECLHLLSVHAVAEAARTELEKVGTTNDV